MASIKSRLYNIKNKQKKYADSDYSFEIKFDQSSFVTWYMKTRDKQKNCCKYCGVNQDDIDKLVESGIISSKRFSKRGGSLEIERIDPNGPYSEDNCVLVCYFCNNDKSDIISREDYESFFCVKDKESGLTQRQKWISHLLKKEKIGSASE